MNTVAATPEKTRIGAVELVAQSVLALAIALAIAVSLGGIALLLAGAAQT